jgi:hypothetical protein
MSKKQARNAAIVPFGRRMAGSACRKIAGALLELRKTGTRKAGKTTVPAGAETR